MLIDNLLLVVYDLAGLINGINSTITEIAWSLFLVAWGVGSLMRGGPIPIFKVKRLGQDFLEDALLAMLLFALGSTIVTFIQSIPGQI